MTAEKYKKAQDAWIEMHDLKAGDSVKILRTASNYENGWDNSWNSIMGSSVSETIVLRENFDRNARGIRIDGYNYPFFVLEVIKNKLPLNIPISDAYHVKFVGDGKIEVGCQKIPFDLLEKIYNTAKSTL